MKTYLTIKNYRCFARPVEIEITKGFTGFVGVNNAGKSSLMRFLVEFRPVFAALANPNLIVGLVGSGSAQAVQLAYVLDNEEVFSNRNNNSIEFALRFEYGPQDTQRFKSQTVEEYQFVTSRNMHITGDLLIDGQRIKALGPIGQSNANLTINAQAAAALRTVTSTFESLASTLYIGPFRNTLNIGGKNDYLDIRIGEAFNVQFREWKTGNNKRTNTAISNLTEEIRQVFRFDSLDISPTPDAQSLHLTVNAKAYKQHELGSGLTHFVIVLANAAFKNAKWILIDEPELNLHPALQLAFLTTLAKYAQEGVWFSSHSIGLARSAASKVYSVIRIGEGDSDIRALAGIPRLSEFLGEMSFSSHKELGFEQVLLVEGPTEVPTFQELLRKLCKDHRVLLLPLHGHMPKADELEELLRISTSIAALIDSERDSATAPLNRDRGDFLGLCADRGLKGHALDRRATENYFPDDVIKRVFGSQYRALTPYEKLQDTNPHWSKNQNWKIAADMNFSDIENTDRSGSISRKALKVLVSA